MALPTPPAPRRVPCATAGHAPRPAGHRPGCAPLNTRCGGTGGSLSPPPRHGEVLRPCGMFHNTRRVPPSLTPLPPRAPQASTKISAIREKAFSRHILCL